MIKRLLGIAWTMIVYACVGTIISQAVILMYLISTWKIDNRRWLSVIAAAQGINSAESADTQTKDAEEKVAEQPSLDQILETRALKYRNLELREQELKNSLSQFQLEQTKLAEDKKSYKQLRDDFDAQLLSMREGSVASGKDEVRNTLENLKPKQAKALILEMLNKKEIDDVVTLLSPMPDAKLRQDLRRIQNGRGNGAIKRGFAADSNRFAHSQRARKHSPTTGTIKNNTIIAQLGPCWGSS